MNIHFCAGPQQALNHLDKSWLLKKGQLRGHQSCGVMLHLMGLEGPQTCIQTAVLPLPHCGLLGKLLHVSASIPGQTGLV